MMDFRKWTSVGLLRAGCLASRLDIFGQWRWLQEANRWTPEQRAAWRLQRLGDILEFAWNEVPFYREFWGDHGVSFSRPKDLSDLERYPVLTKQLFRENSSRIRPAKVDAIRHMTKSTGGSTSVPVGYLLDLEQWSMMEAFHLWGWAQAGYEVGDPVGVIAGGSLVPKRMAWKSRLRSFAQRRLFLYGVAMDQEMARDYHGRLTRYGAQFLYGYPSVMYLFAKNLHDLGLTLPGLKAVVTTAEMLLPQYRKGIEEWLGCPVFNDYGSNDGGTESYECRLHQGFHYNDLQSILETDHSGASGAEGALLITNLWNRSTPFIRYENGDIAKLSNQRCACGAAFPLIASVQGRTTDIISFSNGRSLSGPALTLIFGKMAIDGWQIVQTGGMAMEVRLCGTGELVRQYGDEITTILRHHLSEGVQLSIKQVATLTLTQGGKLKPVINEFAVS